MTIFTPNEIERIGKTKETNDKIEDFFQLVLVPYFKK